MKAKISWSVREAAGAPAALFCPHFNRNKEWSCTLRLMTFEFALWLVVLTGAAGAQMGSNASSVPGPGAITNPVRQEAMPFEFGVLAQGGFGVTQNRGGFKFLSAGLHAGKVLTPTIGNGLLRGNFEYAAEVFPFWQSYTPTMTRQNCLPVATGSSTYLCSAYFNVGGTFSGASITPDILRWNFAGTRRFAPWVQGAGGLLWTNHKYPAFGGPPAFPPGSIVVNPGNTIGNDSANAETSVWNFTPQFGVGAHYFVSPKRSIDFAANAIHISSASLGDKNPGVNASVQFTVGYSWWK